MTLRFEVRQFSVLGPEIAPLIREAGLAGFPFMDTLQREWADGSNRFDQPGEAYLGVWQQQQLIAAGGLNRDPYAQDPAVGRVRHVYVLQAHRRSGAGRFLLRQIVERAGAQFTLLRLRTRTAEGAAFYESLGFDRSDDSSATHILTEAAA